MELKRLPFQRRPIADPGTTLVFQMPDNQLVTPQYPYTTGETWWRGPKAAYVVDIRPHGASFTCQLPAAGDAVFFQATVNYTWSVAEPVTVVSQQVLTPEADCQAYLFQVLPRVTRRHEYGKPAAAEEELQKWLTGRPLDLAGRGLRIDNVYAHLRISAEQITALADLSVASVERERDLDRARRDAELSMLAERATIERQAARQEQMDAIIGGGPERLYAFVLQQDQTKGLEVVGQMAAMADREKQRALEAMKVLIDGGEIRVGELDGAVAAAVGNFRAILGQYNAPGAELPAADKADAGKADAGKADAEKAGTSGEPG
ncbi:hypothetical protein [Actinoplanes sp. NPDC051494]|uniref:hypothetical protein n=1 Tax=Actinoplanes sp. NPDC051494 TaxID=3363907 RepID=UPI0037BDDEF4